MSHVSVYGAQNQAQVLASEVHIYIVCKGLPTAKSTRREVLGCSFHMSQLTQDPLLAKR